MHTVLIYASLDFLFSFMKFALSSSFYFAVISTLFIFQEMTPEAEIISKRYTKSVIKSCAALSYVEAQARMDDRC